MPASKKVAFENGAFCRDSGSSSMTKFQSKGKCNKLLKRMAPGGSGSSSDDGDG